MKKVLAWETFINKENSCGGTHTSRLKVYGGWCVMHLMWNVDQHTGSESMCFVPDPEHIWTL
jgi:hypothetical protein